MIFRNTYLIPFLLLFVTFSFSSYKQNIIDNSFTAAYQNDTSHFSAKIDGKTIEFTVGENKIVNGSNTLKTFKKLPDTSSIIYQSFLYKYPTGQAEITISIGTLRFMGLKISKKAYSEFIKTGAYPFSKYAENGVEITYRDKKDDVWTTGKGNQENSTFEITELKTDSISIKFKALFKCTLFNSAGETKSLEDGQFTGYFRNN
jgi:hypothetical protein